MGPTIFVQVVEQNFWEIWIRQYPGCIYRAKTATQIENRVDVELICSNFRHIDFKNLERFWFWP